MSMAPFHKVPLKDLGSSVGVVPTDLTVIVYIEAMQLIQPIGNGFAIPTQGQVLGVVDHLILFIFVFSLTDLFFLFLSFLSCLGLFALHIFMSEMSPFPKNLYIFINLGFKESNVFIPLSVPFGSP